jgi:hypothetical protein
MAPQQLLEDAVNCSNPICKKTRASKCAGNVTWAAKVKATQLGGDSSEGGIWALWGLFAILGSLGVLRSMGWTFIEAVHSGGGNWRAVSVIVLLLAMFSILGWMARSAAGATYMLGGSVALGLFPMLPKLHFLQDVTHIALLIFLIANWRNLHRRFGVSLAGDLQIKAHALFVLTALVSVMLNFLLRGDIWQLKVGLAALLVALIFFAAHLSVVASPESDTFGLLLKGFLDSAQIAAVAGSVVLVLLVITPLSAGLAGDGRDTVWGFAYFDRFKLLFDGPGVAGSYFVIAMSFAIYAVSEHVDVVKSWRKNGLWFLIQIAPWFVVASGSRVAKIALVVLILSGLFCRPFRKATAIVLPSFSVAMLVGLDFQSFSSAVWFSLGHMSPSSFDAQNLESMRLGSRFFESGERGDLMHRAREEFSGSSLLNQILGLGYGVSGYSAAPYPSPHNQIGDLLVEVGFCGLGAYLALWIACCWSAFAHSLKEKGRALIVMWPIFVGLISIAGLSIAYETGARGIVLVFLLTLVSWVHGGCGDIRRCLAR